MLEPRGQVAHPPWRDPRRVCGSRFESGAKANKAFHGWLPPKQGMQRTPFIGHARDPSRHLHTPHLPSPLNKPSTLSIFHVRKQRFMKVAQVAE